jgi:hypothetical protein
MRDVCFCSFCPVAARNIMFTSDDICVIIDYGMMKEMRKINQGDERYYRQSNEVPKPVRWYGFNVVFYIYLLFFYLRFLPPLTVKEYVFFPCWVLFDGTGWPLRLTTHRQCLHTRPMYK